MDDFKDVDGNENGRVTWYEYLTHLHTTEQEIKALHVKKNRSKLEEKLLTVCLITKNMSRVMRKPTFWFPTWSDTNPAVQLQKMARGLEISDLESRVIVLFM